MDYKQINSTYHKRLQQASTNDLAALPGQPEANVRQEQDDLHHDKSEELYIMVKQNTLQNWFNDGYIYSNNIDSNTGLRHG
eukprot:1017609-Amphidinium_carterae.1